MAHAVAAELQNVTKVYRRSHLGKLTITPGVADLSLEVRQGEVFGLLGLNGAGKTTTIKLLLGLLFPTQGRVALFQQPLPNLGIMNKVGYLPELPNFYKYLTVQELLELYATLSDLPALTLRTRIPQIIEQVGLTLHAKKKLREYSKGMLQRAGLAQALLHNPDLLVLDEPVSGLDPLGLKEMRQLLEKMNQEGKTIFFSSHIISEAEKLCHRVGILHAGKLAAVIDRAEWSGKPGRLEERFLEVIRVRKLFGIARYTFMEILRNRVWYVLILFSGILILSSLLLGDLAGELKSRVITDLGLAAIETIALLSTVFAAVTLVLEEMESRTLYLILTRPVGRFTFISGRFAGLVAIMTSAYLLMGLAHIALLASVGAPVDFHYGLSLFFSWQKIVVITAVALVFSLFSTSTTSAATFTFFFWIMGHFSAEVLFLAQRSSKPLLVGLCKAFYYVFPNFQTMNIRDLPPDLYSPAWLWSAAGYGVLYTASCLLVTAFLFRKKEF